MAGSRDKRWLRRAALVVIIGVAIALNQGLRLGANNLPRAAIARLASGDPHWANLTTPNAGEQALSEPVRLMVTMLRDNGVSAYAMSPQLSANTFVRYRLTEGAWPIRPDPSAAVRIAYLVERHPCQTLDERRFDPRWRLATRRAELFRGKLGVQLVTCP